MILAIDPGCTESAYVLLDEKLKPVEFGKVINQEMFKIMDSIAIRYEVREMAIEMIASYGMSVGKEIFETCVWIGRFLEKWWPYENTYIYRMDEKMNLCHSMKANDSNIRQALIDRFGPVGTKKAPGWFYGVSKDVWSAIAVGVTYHDMYLKETTQ